MRIVRLLVNVHVVVNTKHFLLYPLEFDVKKVELNRTRKHKRSILSYNHLHLQQGIIHRQQVGFCLKFLCGLVKLLSTLKSSHVNPIVGLIASSVSIQTSKCRISLVKCRRLHMIGC